MSEPTLLILASLADGDKHGYAMMEDIQAFTSIRLCPGTLYGAINRRRQPYRLTAKGRTELNEQLTNLERISRTARLRMNKA